MALFIIPLRFKISPPSVCPSTLGFPFLWSRHFDFSLMVPYRFLWALPRYCLLSPPSQSPFLQGKAFNFRERKPFLFFAFSSETQSPLFLGHSGSWWPRPCPSPFVPPPSLRPSELSLHSVAFELGISGTYALPPLCVSTRFAFAPPTSMLSLTLFRLCLSWTWIRFPRCAVRWAFSVKQTLGSLPLAFSPLFLVDYRREGAVGRLPIVLVCLYRIPC